MNSDTHVRFVDYSSYIAGLPQQQKAGQALGANSTDDETGVTAIN
jgi:hypothetical protein